MSKGEGWDEKKIGTKKESEVRFCFSFNRLESLFNCDSSRAILGRVSSTNTPLAIAVQLVTDRVSRRHRPG